MKKKSALEAGWLHTLEAEFDKPYMHKLCSFLQEEKEQGKIIYPPASEWFNAFHSTPFEKVKVVILGQDPYHGPRQAHGLCFSVQQGVTCPPSLKNIFKELQQDVCISPPSHGCLQAWADQGVLLLNAVLTVEAGKAGAHQGKGWEVFTDAAIQALNEKRQGIVFMLWGSYAQKKGAMINTEKHCVLTSPHPSPLSAYRGFLGNQHFSSCNHYLESKSLKPIDWGLD